VNSPVNSAVLIGSEVAIDCCRRPGANTSFRWYFYPPSSNQPQVIHTAIELRAQFAARHDVITDHSSGHSRLTIKGVRLEDAGIYSCYELSASRAATKQAVELVVLGKIYITCRPQRLTVK